jgi:hypothetical protein
MDKFINQDIFILKPDAELIKYCDKRIKSIDYKNKSNINILYETIYILNFYFRLCGFMMLTNYNSGWKKLEKKITELIKYIYTDKQLIMFIQEHDHKNKIKKVIYANSEKYVKKIYKTSIQDHNLYMVKQGDEDSRSKRHKSEAKYCDEVSKLIPNFIKVLALRINNPTKIYNTPNNVKQIINHVNENIMQKAKSETEFLKAEHSLNKLNRCDVIYFNEKYKNKYKFKPKLVFTAMIDLLQQYFNIKLQKTDIETNGSTRYNVMHGPSHIGIVYINFASKTIDKNQCIYINITGPADFGDKEFVAISTITGNYDAYMYYDEIVLLFREFGYFIHNLTNNEKKYIYNEFYANLMEHIAMNKETINMIANMHKIIENKNEIIDNIIFAYRMSAGLNIQIECVNAFFDFIIHNSMDFVNMIEKEHNQTNMLISLYKKIHDEIIKIDIHIEGLEPDIILKELDDAYNPYNNIMNKIISYRLLTLMNSKKNPFLKEQKLQQIDSIIDGYIHDKELYTTYFTYINGVQPKPVIRESPDILYKDKFYKDDAVAETDNYFNDATETEHDVINKLHYKY